MWRIIILSIIVMLSLIQMSFAQTPPTIECGGLPGCDSSGGEGAYTLIWNIIAKGIQYVAVFAVLMGMIGGIKYILSFWSEERDQNARNTMIWAFAWVIVSGLAWAIINFINNIRI